MLLILFTIIIEKQNQNIKQTSKKLAQQMKNVKMQVDMITKLKPKKDEKNIDIGVCTGDSLISIEANRSKRASYNDTHTEYESIIQNNSLETLYISFDNINAESRKQQQNWKRHSNEIQKSVQYGNMINKQVNSPFHKKRRQNKRMLAQENNITNLQISLQQDSMREETLKPKIIQGNSSSLSNLIREGCHQTEKRSQKVKKQQQQMLKIIEGSQKGFSDKKNNVDVGNLKVSINSERKLDETEKMKPKYSLKQYFEEIVENKQRIQQQRNSKYQQQLMEQYYLKIVNTEYQKSKLGSRMKNQNPESSYSKSKYSFNSGFGVQKSHQTKIDEIKDNVEKKQKKKKISLCNLLNPSKWCRDSENIQNF